MTWSTQAEELHMGMHSLQADVDMAQAEVDMVHTCSTCSFLNQRVLLGSSSILGTAYLQLCSMHCLSGIGMCCPGRNKALELLI